MYNVCIYQHSCYLWQGSRGGGQGIDGPDGEQRDGGEGEEPAQRGGPAWSDYAFPEAQRRPTHQGKQKSSLQEPRRLGQLVFANTALN